MKKIILCAIWVCAFADQSALESINAELLAQDGSIKSFSVERGRAIYFAIQKDKNGAPINCATCHSDNLKSYGKNVTTGKTIEPLAPSVNKMRLTDVNEIQKWLKRNFKQVYGREGTAREKGDVLAFIAAQ